jgi:hypothetical protein
MQPLIERIEVVPAPAPVFGPDRLSIVWKA